MILFAAPGFYHGAETIDDLVDFVVARILDQLGLDNTLIAAVGPMTHESGTLPAEGVRAMFDRIAPVYDVMNRVMTVGLDQRWRRLTVQSVVRPGDRVLDACCGTGDLAVAARAAGGDVVGLDFSERMLERARRKDATVEWVRGDLLALPVRGRVVRRGDGRLRRPQRRRPRAGARRAAPRAPSRRPASACSRSRVRAGRCGSSSGSGSTC